MLLSDLQCDKIDKGGLCQCVGDMGMHRVNRLLPSWVIEWGSLCRHKLCCTRKLSCWSISMKSEHSDN